MSSVSPDKAVKFVSSLLQLDPPPDHAGILELASAIGLDQTKTERLLSDARFSQVVEDQSHFSVHVVQVEPSQTALISNGKVTSLHDAFL